MRVLLYDHSGCLNRGCEAIVRTTVDIVKRAFPDSRFGLLSYNAQEDIILSDVKNLSVAQASAQSLTGIKKYVNAISFKVFNSIEYYYKTAYADSLEFAKNYDLCLIIGGDTFCYGNNELCRKLTANFKKRGKKIVLWGCSVGEEDLTQEKIETLKSLDGIFARESFTKSVLESKGLTNVSLFADPAFVLPKSEVELPEIQGDLFGFNISPLIARRTKNLGTAAAQLIHYIEHNTDYIPLLVPHVTVKGNDDYRFLAAIKNVAKSEKSILLPSNLGAREYKGYISKAKVFMGARTHSIIGAYSSGVPALALGYSIKARGIANDLFGSELCVHGIDEIQSGADLIACFEELEANRENMKKVLDERIPQTVELAYSAGEALKKII